MSSKKKYDANADIRKYGPQNYLLLQQANASRTGGLDALKGIEAKMNTTPLSITDNPYGPRLSGALRVSPEGVLLDYWGNSMFDTEMTTEGQLLDVQYQRAENEPWVLKALNGVTKAVGTAATTWLDGVAGLALGLTEGIYGAIADPNRNFFLAFNHGLYNNEISKGLREFSQWMEEALPNYKTKDEELNPYTLKNLTSVNTIFNDFLKVIGFSVGAYYSGGAWNKVLGLLTKAGTLSSTAAKTIGSVVSGVNEARIEAGNLYDENVREQTGELMNAYLRASDELLLQIDALNEQPDTREKAIQLALLQQLQTELDSKYELEVNNIKDRAEKAALADMYMNAAYLPFQDAWAYGRLYRRASRMKHTLGKAVEETSDVAEDAARKASKETAKNVGKKKLIDLAAELEAVEKGLSEAVEDGAEGYKAKIVSRKKAALKGLAKAGGEYTEEVNQGFFSSFSSNFYTPDSPDAYYLALTNEDYKIKTNDFRTAMTHGIMDSWGNPASHVEGLMGFINGLLGMPTFGRVQNSDENTYLGKGKPVGLSGGILGEMKYYARRNKEALEAADIMNKTTKKLKDKSDDASNFITRMLAFSNAMDGFNEDDDKFEFKNASDNEMFNAIDAFARTGRLDHFKQLVKDGFGDPEQFTDEQLEDISRTAGKNEWLTTDGKPMVESEEGRQLMRKELKKQLQDTLNAIDRYEKSLERVRLISNNSLTNDLTAELAWLHWKLSLFEDRFKDIKSDNEELFNKMAEEMLRVSDEYQGALDDTVSDELLQEEKKRLEEELKRTDLTPEERKDLRDDLEATNAGIAARNEASSLKSILLFIKALKDAKTPLDLAAIIASNPSIMDYLNTTFNTTLDSEGVKMEKTKSWRDFYNQFEDKLGISFDDFSNVMDNLRDSAKLAIAARDFNKRFMEFSEDPIKLIENREKIDKKAAKENKAKTKAKGVDRLNNMEISEIAMGLRDGSIDLEEATKAMEGMDFENVEGGPLNAKEKLEEALKINDKYSDAIEKIEQLHQDGIIDDPTYNSAIQALEQSLAIAESVEELLDINGEAFLDNDNIYTSDLENLPLDLLEEEIEKRRALVLTVINGISQDLIDAVEATQDMPNTLDIEDSVDLQDETVLNDTTGHDSIDKPKAENVREELRKNLEPLGPITEWTARQIATGAVLAVNTSPENEEGLINIVTDLGNIMDSLIKGGIENKKIAETIKDLQGYSMLKAIAGEELANAILNNYLVARRQNLDAISTAKQDTIELEKSNNKEDDVDPPTPDITIDDIESLIEEESQRDYSEGEVEVSTPILNYWKPTVTELPEHRDRGNNKPYWEIAKDLKKPNGSPRYTAAQLQRMKAVGEYMQEKQAFSRVNAGQVLSKNDGLNATEVHFITDRALNEKAGEVVILMVDSKGNIIGDLMSKNDPAAQKQAGLIPFIEKCELILANDKTSNNLVALRGSTTVLQNLIGKVMYTKKSETHTLNEIHGDLEFKLGIAVTEGTMPIIRTSGRAKKLGTTEEEDSIVTPLKSKNGLAFLIMPTSGAAKRGVARKYVTVPFHMPKYSEQTKDSALGRAIEDILKRIAQGSNDEDAVKLKNELSELISVARSKNGYPEIHINYTGDIVKVTIKPVGADHLITLYNGNKNNENMVSNIQSKLYGTPFQINRKYINRDYKGLSYNRMIGELARTNIAVGETHTRSDWFTINPIGADGKQVAGSKILSKKLNPGALKPASASGAPAGSIEVSYNGGSAYVDTNTWDVWYNGKNYGKATGLNVNKVRARAYGIKENLDMSKPYDTTWGYYNPVTDSFETKPKPEPEPKEDKIVDWIVSGETKFKINTNTWLVLNADGTEYNGPDINVYRAKVYGLIHELDMKKPYLTPWGIFNPRDNSFIINDDYSELRQRYNLGDNVTIIKNKNGIIIPIGAHIKVTLKDGLTAYSLTILNTKKLAEKNELEIRDGAGGYLNIDLDNVVKVEISNDSGRTFQQFAPELNDEIYETPLGIFNPKTEELNTSSLIISTPSFFSSMKSYLENYTSKWDYYTEDESNTRDTKDGVLILGLAINQLDLAITTAIASGILGEEYRLEIDPESHNAIVSILNSEKARLAVKELQKLGIRRPNLILEFIEKYQGKSLEEARELNKRTYGKKESIEDKGTEENKKKEEPQKATKNTPQELRDMAKANGLINTAAKKAVWEALTTELQLKLIDNIKMKQRQLMQGLVSAFNKSDNTFDKKALGGSVDLFLNKKALFSKVGQRNYGKKWDLAKELTKMEKMLPLFTKGELIKILKGLIRIADSSNPGLAYGMFQSGVITISEVAASGTLYHEAFHAVYHTLMSDAERQKIMDSAALLYGADKTQLELEETLAEDFRKYVLFREALEAEMKEKYANKSILGRIMRFFKSLFNLCKKIKGKEPYMNKIFKDIYNGRYAKRKVLEYDAETRFKYEDFTPEMISIIKKAPRDSEGRLLAPNGKPSNLNERQYAQVRTKAFKEWFGDWETLAYDNADLDYIPNLNRINTAEFIDKVNKYLEKDFITREFLSREAVNIINQLFKNIKDVEIFSGDIKEQGLSFYSGKIVISNNIPLSDQAATFVHEIIHNFTTYSYDTNSEFRDEINKYHKRAYIYARKNNLSINSDVYEFMANILSPDTAETLMKIPSDNEKSNLLKDIISSFVKALRIFTNNEIIRGRRTLFHDVVETIYNNQKDNKAFNNDVSKVVDENGEPLVVYSGRPTKNTTTFNLDSKRNRTQLTSLLKKGVYFTKDKNVADLYKGSKIYNNELDRELVKYGAGEDGSIFLNKSAFLKNHPNITSEHYDKLLDRYNSNINDSNNPTGEFIPDVTHDAGETIAAFLNIRNPYVVNLNGKSIAHLSSTDVEAINNSNGAIINNVDEHTSDYPTPTITTDYIVFNSNQIKSATDNIGTYSKENNDIRYSRVGITELQLEIDDANRLIQEIRRLMEIAKNRVSKGNWVREKGGNRYGILSNIGYFYESDAEDNIPDDIREVAEVKYHRGRYTIQYNPQLCISKIKFLTQQMYDLQALIELLKEYNDSFPEDRALSDMALRELQQREDMLDLIAEIRQYHSDKLMFSNLSKEDLDYILRRGISLEEYNMMSDLEKRVLLECKS